ncbi:Hypothetical predicted protein [Cloeon dipterum]|uniref:UPF3 domain-containing protein n=1 Tax=Cloeon dipterum TaxID=197152 RepID=A0A8S1D247_9INSE|nr:Hypothetical predicted protein [Cloeon dipterum]
MKSRPAKSAPPTPPTKVVIRHLPAMMTEETFIEEVSPLPKYDYLSFVNADPELGQFAFSRAYINFCNQEDIFIFTEKFDGYVFVDSKGDEHSAIVEFAPFQKTPKKANRKKDNKCGTIETDSEYLKFLEIYEKSNDSETPPSSAVENLEEINAKERELKANKGGAKVSTPLLDYLRKKKEDRIRIREERKEERDKKRAEKKKIKDDEKKKQKDKRYQEKIKQSSSKEKSEKPAPRVLSAKPKEDTSISEEELTKNLKDVLKIAEEKETADAPEIPKKEHQPSETKKHHPGKDHKFDKPEQLKKKDIKRDKKYQGPSEEKKSTQQNLAKSENKSKPVSHPKETKSYREERQKTKEARAARAAAKQESASQQSKPAESAEQPKAESEDSTSSSKGPVEGSSKPNRVRNKDRPAMQIYRPGMLKRGDSKSSTDGAEVSSSAKQGGEEVQKQTKSRTFVSKRRKPAANEQHENSA